MKSSHRQDRAWFLATAKAVAKSLKQRSDGTSLRIRIPGQATDTNTDGWRTVIGDLGRGKPRLEIWFDRFSGYPERKLYACFFTMNRQQITAITKQVSKTLWPVRQITMADTLDEKFLERVINFS
jgi:hypothetical protein